LQDGKIIFAEKDTKSEPVKELETSAKD